MMRVADAAFAADKLCMQGNPELWERGNKARVRMVDAYVVPSGLGLPESTCAVRCARKYAPGTLS